MSCSVCFQVPWCNSLHQLVFCNLLHFSDKDGLNISLQITVDAVTLILSVPSRVFMLLSCIGQRSLSNSGVLEGLLNLLDNLLSPLQQPQATFQRRTEGNFCVKWLYKRTLKLLKVVTKMPKRCNLMKYL